MVAVTQLPQDINHILVNLASAKLNTLTFVLLLITVAGYLQDFTFAVAVLSHLYIKH